MGDRRRNVRTELAAHSASENPGTRDPIANRNTFSANEKKKISNTITRVTLTILEEHVPCMRVSHLSSPDSVSFALLSCTSHDGSASQPPIHYISPMPRLLVSLCTSSVLPHSIPKYIHRLSPADDLRKCCSTIIRVFALRVSHKLVLVPSSTAEMLQG